MFSRHSHAAVGKSGHLRGVGRWMVVGTVALVVSAFGAVSATPPIPAQADSFQQPPDPGCPVGTYQVAWGVEQVAFNAIGQAGQAGQPSSGHGGGAGGLGGQVVGRLPVQAGEDLFVNIGTDGAGVTPSSSAGNGGFGGATSMIYLPSTSNECSGTPLVIAAGGGGGGGGDTFGPGGTGGEAGAAGNPGGSNESEAGGGGGGATTSAGGTGGAAGHGNPICSDAGDGGAGAAWNNAFSSGGIGGEGCSGGGGSSGGGGGGGYFGGGGGGGSADDGAGGGGGGASWADPSATRVTIGNASVDPSVSINPAVWATATTVSSSNSDEGSTTTGVTYTATVVSPPPAPPGYTPPPNPPANPAAPSLGTVHFVATQGSTTVDMGSASVIGGTATLPPYVLPPGVWSVVGTYSGGDGTQWFETGFTGSTSSPLSQTMGTAPKITTQPVASVSTYPPGGAHFSAAASGDPAPTYAWQDLNGGAWTTIGTGSTLDLICEFCDGSYRVVATNLLGSAISNVVGAVTSHAPVVQPISDVNAPLGGSATFTAFGAAYPAPTAHWQVSTDGGSTWVAPDPSRTTMTTTQPPNSSEYGWESTLTYHQVLSGDNGTKVRVTFSNTVSNATQSVTSNAATLHLLPSCIAPNPSPTNFSHCAGANLAGLDLQGIDLSFGDYTGASFVGTNLDRTTWLGANATGAFLIGATLNQTNFDFANLTNANLTDDDLSLAYIAQANVTGTLLMPTDTTVYTTGSNASVTWPTPRSLGTQDFNCTIPSSSYSPGSPTTPVSSGDLFPLDTTSNGTTVTCYVSTLFSSPAQGTFHVHVIGAVAPQLTQQPADQTVVWQPGEYIAGFTAAASGTPSPTVQWQLSTDGGHSWSDISGANSPQYFVVDPPFGASGNEYRAVFTNMAGTITSDPATLQVDPQPVNVLANGSQTFGDTAPTFAQSFNNPPGETVQGTLSCADVFGFAGPQDVPITPEMAPGTYEVDPASCSGLSLSPDATDYALVYQPDLFVVSPATITVNVSGTWTPASGPPTYTETDNAPDGLLPSPKWITCQTVDGGQSITAMPGSYTLDGSSCSYNPAFTSPDYTVQFAGVTDGFTVTGNVHVAVTGSENYGGTPTFSVLGTDAMSQGVSLSNLSGLTCTPPAPAPSATSLQVGNYTVSGATCSGLTDAPSFPIDYVDGPFTVNPAPLTVTADNKSMTYGGAVPSLTASITGFVNSESLATSGVTGVASCTTTATHTSAPGTYAIVCTPGTLTASNYDIPDSSFVAGTLTVNPAPLTVTADNKSMTYGGAVPSLTGTVSGFVNGQTLGTSDVTGAASCSTTATSTSPVGTDAITCAIGSLSSKDYAFPSANFVAGTLTINPAPLTVTADNKSMTYGGSVPSLTGTVSGFVNSQTLGTSGVTGTPSCNTMASSTSPVGTYAIACTIGGLSASNYSFPSADFVAGTLTVNPAPLTVTADNKSMPYGGSVPSLTGTVSGFVNNQTLSSSGVTGTPSCNTTASSASPVGTYAITCTIGGLSASNYSFPSANFVGATLTVNPAPLTVTADNKSMTYGDPLPTLTATITGFVNSQTLSTSGVTGSPKCTSPVTPTTGYGTYTITCTVGTLTAHNYSFPTTPQNSFVTGTVKVAKHPATVGFTGVQFWSTTGSTANVTLQATVTPGSGNVDLTKAGVVFDLYNSNNLSMTAPDATCTAPSVSSTGVANCTMSLGLDSWTVVATIPGSNLYYTAPNADPAVVSVYQPTSGTWVTGGGWVKDTSATVSPSNQHGNFGFNVQTGSSGIKGHSVFVFRGANGYDYVVKSNSWNGGGLAIPTLTTAGFQAKASVIVIDPTTGLQVSGLGGGNYNFRVDVTQGTPATKTAPATPSTYAISVYNGSGVLWHQAGTTAQQLPLGGGNIVVHQK